MLIRTVSGALVAASLAISPVAAQDASPTRGSEQTTESSELGGSPLAIAFAAVAAAIVIWALIENLGDDDDSVSA
jgi:hypothetical protein